MSEKAGPYLTGIAPAPQRLVISGITEQIAGDVEQSGAIDHCEATEEGLINRSVASVEAASPLPLDDEGHADRRLIADLARHDRRVAGAETHAEACRARHRGLEDALLRTPRCWGRGVLCVVAAVYVAGAAMAGAVVGAVLAPSVDGGFFGNYLGSKFDGDAGLFAMVVSYLAAGGSVFLLCLLQLCTVLGTGGHLGAFRTAQLVVLDLIFAGAWGLQRLADGGRAMAMSITLLEFVMMAVYAAALGALAVALRKNGERAERYRPAAADERAAKTACEKAEAALAADEAARNVLLDAVAARELAGRTAGSRKTLVTELAKTAYRVSTGAAIESALANPTLERFNTDFDRHLASRAALVAEPPTTKGLS